MSAHRIVLILIALAAIMLAGQSASAQGASGKAAGVAPKETVLGQAGEEIMRWGRVLDRAAQQLDEGGLSAGVLDQMRETVSDVQIRAVASRPVFAGDVERTRKLVVALGPAPKEGEQPEAPEIAAQREELNARFTEADGRLKQLDLLIEKSRGLLSAIGVAEQAALGDRLLARTPSLISGRTWSTSATEFASLIGQANRALYQWSGSPEVHEAATSGYFAFAVAAVLAAAALGWFLRRWLVRRFGRKRDVENPNFRMRVLAVFAESAARIVIPILVVVAAYAALRAGGFLFGLSDQIAIGIVLATIVFSLLYGLPRAMLSPALPQWRLAALGNFAARLWFRYALILAAIVSFDMMLIVPAAELQPSQTLQSTYNFIIDGAYALVFFLIATDSRLWLTPEEELRVHAPAVTPRKPPQDEPRVRNRWWLVARVIIVIVALAIPATALAGYGVLSDFIARRLLATAAVFLIALVLHGLARDLVAIFTHETEMPPAGRGEGNPLYVWSVLFLDIGLMLTMAFLIVPLWGGQWSSVFDRLGWSLTGFKVGDHFFSITDVVAGMVAFVIVIALVRSIQHFVNRRILQPTRMDTGVRDALTKGIGYFGLVIAVLVAINTAGIDLSGLTIVAGALSVGVGFGLQSVVNNFVSGLILLAERPIKVGDWVVVGAHEGIVKRISVRSTEIKTFSRASVIVPNSELIANSVVNWMHKDRSGRLEIPVGVSYDSDVNLVRDVLLRCAAEHDSVLPAPEPRVIFKDFGDNALLFELRCFVADVDRRLFTSSDLRFAIERAFREAGISIPFPQRDLHIKDAGALAGAAPAGAAARRKAAAKSASGKSAARRR